jgi:hypothetical protein
MTPCRLRLLLGVTALVTLFFVGKSALGDDGKPPSRTRLPATVSEVNRFIDSGKGLRTLDEVRHMSGTAPVCIAPLVYRWRLADGLLDTVTSRSKEGEFITCWGPVR